MNVYQQFTDNVNVYNILEHNVNSESESRTRNERGLDRLVKKHISILHEDPLSKLMNGQIKEKLGIPSNVTWGGKYYIAL